jgi:hypothetical protein
VKLKRDANLGIRGRQLLIDAGHDVSTAELQGLALASDDALIAVCAAEGRALVTLDTDFANAEATASDIEAALAALLQAVGDARVMGRLLIVEPTGRVREYSSADESEGA